MKVELMFVTDTGQHSVEFELPPTTEKEILKYLPYAVEVLAFFPDWEGKEDETEYDGFIG